MWWNSLWGNLLLTFLVAMVPVIELRGAIPFGVARDLNLWAAIAAAVATGEYPDLETAVKEMTKVTRRFEPDPERTGTYDRKYRLYCRTIDCLDGLWTEMQTMIEGGA